MRLAYLVASALLATGCGVPDVTFTDGGASRDVAVVDTSVDVEQDGSSPADGEAGSGDAGDAGDARTGGPIYCRGDAGPPVDAGPPNASYTCCPSGAVCSGTCKPMACSHCGTCTWPSVCCPNGNNGICTPPDGGPC